jgi:hypothetical protein
MSQKHVVGRTRSTRNKFIAWKTSRKTSQKKKRCKCIEIRALIISIRCCNTIRNENYSCKFSRNTKRLIIIGIVASNIDFRTFELFAVELFEYVLHLYCGGVGGNEITNGRRQDLNDDASRRSRRLPHADKVTFIMDRATAAATGLTPLGRTQF